ncbi:kinase-like domain-containing protein [Aspergillus cavernicola]|uniref:Serine/threonine-protein kinase ATG1 n=1 Tax=Aspergillus cavernicola TaxID=176166 RepID=A0ABR4IN43_9EURO
MATIPELVSDSKLNVRFFSDYVSHEVFDPILAPRGRVRRRMKEEKWRRDKCIGRGCYGTVWLERCLGDSKTKVRAVKTVPRTSHSSDNIDYTRELEAMVKFSQKKYAGFFVTLLGWFEDRSSVYMAMEYFDEGDLQMHLSQPLPEMEARQILHQVLEGVEHLHDNGFAHRDLKPANIFVVQRGPEWWVKIGDFGVSKRVKDGSTVFSTLAGTLGYLAPEILQAELGGDTAQLEYTHMVDMWSLGAMAHCILTRSLPFRGLHELSIYARKGHFPDSLLVAHGTSLESHDFIRALMAPKPADRLPAKDALQHDWVSSHFQRPTSLNQEEQTDDNERALRDLPNLEHLSLESSNASRSWGALDKSTLRPRDIQKRSSDSTQQKLKRAEKAESDAPSTFPPQATRSYQMTIRRNKLREPENAIHNQNRGDAPIGPERDRLNSMHSLGMEKLDNEQFSDAEEMLRKAYIGRGALYGFMAEDTLKSMWLLSDCLTNQAKYDEAEHMLRKAYARLEELLGLRYQRTYTTMCCLFYCLFLQGKSKEAERLVREVYELRKSKLGLPEEWVVDVLFMLGGSSYDQGKYSDAERFWEKAYEQAKKTNGPLHESTFEAMNLVGKSRLRQKDFLGAETILHQAYEGRRETCGHLHEGTLQTLEFLAQVFWENGKFTEAIRASQEAYEGQEKTLGPTHKHTISSQRQLEHYLSTQRRHSAKQGR